MRIGTLVVATVGMLVAGVLTATPASATSYRWEFDERPDSLPATSEPAQTLVSATADIRVVSSGDAELRGWIKLGAEPTEATDAVLRISLGDLHDGVCREVWNVEVSTLHPTGLATRTDSTIELSADGITYDQGGPWCGSVSVLTADGARTLLDQLVEPGEWDFVVDDTGGEATVQKVRNHRVVPGRWSTFWVLVGYMGDDATGLTAYGRGADRVDVRGELETALVWGTETWMPVQVRLRGHRAQKVLLHVRPSVGGWSSSVPKEIWIRPQR